MRLLKLLQPAALLASLIAWPAASHANACNNRVQILPVARVVEIDAASGPLYGVLTKNAREPNFLGPKEVVLTFDDGPLPWITRDILATLDRFCAKATFFSVGQMAVAYPETLREIIARGHTLGTHTWSHPLNLRRKTTAAAIDEIERGFAGVTAAAGVDVAPFFRFPGLSDSPALLAYLQSRHIATFTVDVVSNDSYINDPARLLATSLARVEAQRGGIILMHDIKASTARMLPALLTTLAERGYKLVHMVPKDHFEPRPDLMREVAPRVAAMPADTRDTCICRSTARSGRCGWPASTARR